MPKLREKNRGGVPPTKSLQDLLKLESEIIDKLWALCQIDEMADKERVQYFNALASHAKTFAKLLKMAGVKGDESQDLAKLLQKIAKKAHKIARSDFFGKGIKEVKTRRSSVC